MRRRVEYDKGRNRQFLDELYRAPYRIEIDQARPARNENEVGGLRGGECLRPRGRRRIDDGQLKSAGFCGLQAVCQAPLGQEFHVRQAAFAPIRPDGRAFLRVEVEDGGLESARDREIDRQGRLADSPFWAMSAMVFTRVSLSLLQGCITSGVHT